MDATVDAARAAFGQRDWVEAHALLVQADGLDGADLQRLAVAAHLLGRSGESERAWERAHLAFLGEGDPEAAARCAIWLGLTLALRGDQVRAGGWLARSERVLEAVDGSCAARGLLLLPSFFERLDADELAPAAEVAQRMLDIATECGDKDLLAFAVLAQGQVAVARGEGERGMRFLDEVMVSVGAGEVSPIPAGIVYCAVIEACREAYDVRRAASWTAAFTAWCEPQPDVLPFRGQCLVHRAEVLQARGVWADAAAEVLRACELLSEPFHPALGAARYQQGELHRLRGELDAAATAYRAAREHGREPEPGLALLRLAHGDVDGAVVAVRRTLDASPGPADRPTVLAAAVEVFVAAGDLDAAATAADQLAAVAASNPMPLLRAMSAHATGVLRQAEGDPARALESHRRALVGWLDLDMAYDAARARVGMAAAADALGDPDAAALEREAARAVFERVGARPDLDRLDGRTGTGGGPSPLTEREREVLRRVAEGTTNRDIAAALGISQHTVARHLQNIFAKTGTTSRTAAAAFAYRHGIA